jgi:hypothetical protein
MDDCKVSGCWGLRREIRVSRGGRRERQSRQHINRKTRRQSNSTPHLAKRRRNHRSRGISSERSGITSPRPSLSEGAVETRCRHHRPIGALHGGSAEPNSPAESRAGGQAPYPGHARRNGIRSPFETRRDGHQIYTRTRRRPRGLDPNNGHQDFRSQRRDGQCDARSCRRNR